MSFLFEIKKNEEVRFDYKSEKRRFNIKGTTKNLVLQPEEGRILELLLDNFKDGEGPLVSYAEITQRDDISSGSNPAYNMIYKLKQKLIAFGITEEFLEIVHKDSNYFLSCPGGAFSLSKTTSAVVVTRPVLKKSFINKCKNKLKSFNEDLIPQLKINSRKSDDLLSFLNESFILCDKKCLVVESNAGAGKTYSIIQAANLLFEDRSKEKVNPLYISVKDLDRESIYQHIVFIISKSLALSDSEAKKVTFDSLAENSNGHFLLFLDGLDEISLEEQKSLMDAALDILCECDNVQLVVTTRYFHPIKNLLENRLPGDYLCTNLLPLKMKALSGYPKALKTPLVYPLISGLDKKSSIVTSKFEPSNFPIYEIHYSYLVENASGAKKELYTLCLPFLAFKHFVEKKDISMVLDSFDKEARQYNPLFQDFVKPNPFLGSLRNTGLIDDSEFFHMDYEAYLAAKFFSCYIQEISSNTLDLDRAVDELSKVCAKEDATISLGSFSLAKDSQFPEYSLLAYHRYLFYAFVDSEDYITQLQTSYKDTKLEQVKNILEAILNIGLTIGWHKDYTVYEKAADLIKWYIKNCNPTITIISKINTMLFTITSENDYLHSKSASRKKLDTANSIIDLYDELVKRCEKDNLLIDNTELHAKLYSNTGAAYLCKRKAAADLCKREKKKATGRDKAQIIDLEKEQEIALELAKKKHKKALEIRINNTDGKRTKENKAGVARSEMTLATDCYYQGQLDYERNLLDKSRKHFKAAIGHYKKALDQKSSVSDGGLISAPLNFDIYIRIAGCYERMARAAHARSTEMNKCFSYLDKSATDIQQLIKIMGSKKLWFFFEKYLTQWHEHIMKMNYPEYSSLEEVQNRAERLFKEYFNQEALSKA